MISEAAGAGFVAGLRLPPARLFARGVGAGLTISTLTDTCALGRRPAVSPDLVTGGQSGS